MAGLTPDATVTGNMVMSLSHRGPDEAGIHTSQNASLGHCRLSIIDLEGGLQPLHNENKSVWITYNGEIFNYPELRERLARQGHRFYTKTDTEVIVHLYEEKGEALLEELNGQFAFVIWDKKKNKFLMARDRTGIRPLYYSVSAGSLLFASEIKALFSSGKIKRELDYGGLGQLFTFWTPLPPKTVFKNVFELPPAHFMTVSGGRMEINRYWDVEPGGLSHSPEKKDDDYAEELMALLDDAARIRLRADVPVASYLSGGLDSSFISSLVKQKYNPGIQTYSVAFRDKYYDESAHQKTVSDFIGSAHSRIDCSYADIGKAMPDVIWHTEKPLVRTAPAPMFMLSRLVRESGIKVVLTGEGADEMLGGYDLFKEMKIRRFWARQPDSKCRPALLNILHAGISGGASTAPAFIEAFYRTHLSGADKNWYSHIPRWDTTSYIKSFFADDLKGAVSSESVYETIESLLPDGFSSWDSLLKAQYIEIFTLLSGNLLSSQGDRVAMAHSVEGRYPFLDYRVVRYALSLPPRCKIRGLREKYLLKKAAAAYLPADIIARKKQAYRAPESQSFLNAGKLEYVEELLSESNLKNTGIFNPSAVAGLMAKCRNSAPGLVSNKNHMAVTAIITTLLTEKHFISGFEPLLREKLDKFQGRITTVN